MRPRILLGDCLEVLADIELRDAWVCDPPANIGFMGRKRDRAHPAKDYVPLLPPRSKAHLRELQQEHAFTRYWAERFALMYDRSENDAIALVWTLPRTAHQTATAVRAAGWTIRDSVEHLFGSGWMKAKRTNEHGERVPSALAPGHEGWLLCTKGKPRLDVDACRVERGERPNMVHNDNVVNGSTLSGTSTGASQVGTTALGSLPKNVVLSHCEECVRVGSRKVRSGNAKEDKRPLAHNGVFQLKNHHRNGVHFGDAKGTEIIAAWRCMAGCACGARSVWDPARALPRCPCGETWRWLCPVAAINEQSGDRPGMSAGSGKHREGYAGGMFGAIDCEHTTYADRGGAARFFNTFCYLAKASPSERHAGCDDLFWKENKDNPFGFDRIDKAEYEANLVHYEALNRRTKKMEKLVRAGEGYAWGNVHPTVKGLDLVLHMLRLSGGRKIGDLTTGSGGTAIGCQLLGLDFVGAEICPEAIEITNARLDFWTGVSIDGLADLRATANVLQKRLDAEPIEEQQGRLFDGI